MKLKLKYSFLIFGLYYFTSCKNQSPNIELSQNLTSSTIQKDKIDSSFPSFSLLDSQTLTITRIYYGCVGSSFDIINITKVDTQYSISHRQVFSNKLSTKILGSAFKKDLLEFEKYCKYSLRNPIIPAKRDSNTLSTESILKLQIQKGFSILEIPSSNYFGGYDDLIAAIDRQK